MRSNKESGKPDRFGPGCRDHRAHIVPLELCWTCSPATSLAHLMVALLNRASRSEAAFSLGRLCEPYAPAVSKTKAHICLEKARAWQNKHWFSSGASLYGFALISRLL